MGHETYLDIDQFATDIDEAQNDLQNPNRLVGEGDTFKYSYNLSANILNAYAQAQFTFNKLDYYISGSFTNTQYQREGIYQNGAFPDSSLGKGEQLNFTGFGVKGGMTYKFQGNIY